MKKIGLTLGKYAPFHRGHQSIIKKMLIEMDEVVVIIYDCPETIDIPLLHRKKWIEQLYPSVRVIEAWDSPQEVGYTPEIKKSHEDYVLALLDTMGISGITHFYSSEPYGEHMSAALNAENCVVDLGRNDLPISGTQIRKNPYLYRNFLSNSVYRSSLTSVLFLGAPSTGKSTLTEALAKEYGTTFMPEYGREYWEKHQVDRRLSLEDLQNIAATHFLREYHHLLSANTYLFVDTSALTTSVFARYYLGTSNSVIDGFITSHRYDLVFLCDTDIPYENTWDRSGEGNRDLLQRMTLDALHHYNIPYVPVRGDLNTRIAFVKEQLANYKKWGNHGGIL